MDDSVIEIRWRGSVVAVWRITPECIGWIFSAPLPTAGLLAELGTVGRLAAFEGDGDGPHNTAEDRGTPTRWATGISLTGRPCSVPCRAGTGCICLYESGSCWTGRSITTLGGFAVLATPDGVFGVTLDVLATLELDGSGVRRVSSEARFREPPATSSQTFFCASSAASLFMLEAAGEGREEIFWWSRGSGCGVTAEAARVDTLEKSQQTALAARSQPLPGMRTMERTARPVPCGGAMWLVWWMGGGGGGCGGG